MYDEETYPVLMCQDCLYFNIRADQEGVESKCKRLDHKKVKYAIPFFASYTCGEHHLPCRDFVPKYPEYADFKEWTNFEDWWKLFVKFGNGRIYERDDNTMAFTVNGNTDVNYRVPTKKFLDGTMIVDGVLQAVEKTYYKRDKVDLGVQLYKLVHEKINGVRIEDGTEL